MTKWYRTGTVNLTNASATVTGAGCYWKDAANRPEAGDIFTDNNKIYEIASITDNDTLILDRLYEGVTALSVPYAIIRNTSATTNTRIAAQVTQTLEDLGDRVTVSTTAPSVGQGKDGDIWIVASV